MTINILKAEIKDLKSENENLKILTSFSQWKNDFLNGPKVFEFVSLGFRILFERILTIDNDSNKFSKNYLKALQQ